MADDLAANWFMATATARATLRALGATKMTLRVCGGSATGAATGLGLAAPAMESVEVSPVLLRSGNDGSREIVVDACSLEEALGAAAEDVVELLKTSRVEVSGAEFLIADVGCDVLGGAAYLYRLKLEA